MPESVCLSMILGNALGRSLSPSSNSSWCICFTDPCGSGRKPSADNGKCSWLGKTYDLNGPEVLSGPKVASLWSGLLGKEISYLGDDMDAFEEQMREHAPSWSAFDIRMKFQGYLERGFIAEHGDL